MTNLKNCPFCGDEGYIWKRPDDKEIMKCSNANCPLHTANFTVEQWQNRPLESKLLSALINCAELLAEDVPADAVAAIKKALGDQYVETNS